MLLSPLKLSKFPRHLFSVAAASIGIAGIAYRADAALSVTISEAGFAPMTQTDTANSGEVQFSGPYGDFSTNFVIGVTNELNGTQPVANLQVESLDVTSQSNSGPKTLIVTLTDPGYTFPGTNGSTVQLGSSVGGTFTGAITGDSLTFQSFSTAPTVSTAIQSFTVPSSPGTTTPFSSSATPVAFVRGSSFTLSDVTTITLAGAGDTINVSGATTVSAVPEPAIASGIAVASLVLLRRNRRHLKI